MTIANAFRKFFCALNGVEPSGMTIADVVINGTSNVQRNNESALATRMTTAEADIVALESANNVEYEFEDEKSIVLKSSTADSTKSFRISVVDNGTISATEITELGN